MKIVASLLLTLVSTVFAQNGPPSEAVVERMEYADADGAELVGFLSMPEGASADSPVPAVVIIPDWNNVDDYEKLRATMIAQELGWAGFAADIYGAEFENGVPDDMRGTLAGLYRSEQPELFMQRIAAAVDQVAAMPEVDTTKIALVGYCFGGSGVLMFAIDDSSINDNVAAVVSFHGGLGPHVFEHRNMSAAETDNTKPEILVLSGGNDDASSDIQTLEMTLDNSTNTWEITRYWGIEHAWTVWGTDAYNEWADVRSWESMVEFLEEVFGETSFDYSPLGVEGIEAVNYTDSTDGKELRGYLARPDSNRFTSPSPAVVIIPNWDGNNLYEQERAKLLSELGYVAFAADIYGADLQNDLSQDIRIEQSTLYRADNVSLYVSRMQTAIDLVKSYDFVDSENVAMIGYCFGGTGVVQYAFMGMDGVKVVGAFHGNFEEQFLPAIEGPIVPYTMILSGGNDGQHGNQTYVEMMLNNGTAEWEISRWSGVDHGFTEWESDAYNLNADYRSWSAFLTAMGEKMAVPVMIGDGEGEAPVSAPSGESTPTGEAPESPPTGESASSMLNSSIIASLALLLTVNWL